MIFGWYWVPCGLPGLVAWLPPNISAVVNNAVYCTRRYAGYCPVSPYPYRAALGSFSLTNHRKLPIPGFDLPRGRVEKPSSEKISSKILPGHCWKFHRTDHWRGCYFHFLFGIFVQALLFGEIAIFKGIMSDCIDTVFTFVKMKFVIRSSGTHFHKAKSAGFN